MSESKKPGDSLFIMLLASYIFFNVGGSWLVYFLFLGIGTGVNALAMRKRK